MQLAAVQWISSVLRDPEHGVLATIAEGVPGVVDLPLIQIADEVQDAWIAYGTWPNEARSKGPTMIVRAVGSSDGDALPNAGGIETCTVGIHMLVPKTVDGVPDNIARLHSAQYLRIAKRCVSKAQPENVSRNNPKVWGCTIVPAREAVFSFSPLYDPDTLGGGVILDALLVTVSVDDPYSRGYAPDVPTP
jgi:hypothetical protein